MNEASKIHMGYQLRRRLAALNLSQSDFAKRLGYTRQEVSRLIDVRQWYVKTIYRLTKPIKVSATYF
ncbi:MAG: hypothetical protein OJF47_003053 [Nitrospira sp.]|nr:MAG: hypothetical protein OJF47_003053 [Nitrospira sp.]